MEVEETMGDAMPAEARRTVEGMSDEEVVRRVEAGEPALFEILMRRYNQRLFRVARSVVRDDAEAEDVVQQAYVNAFTHLGQFAGTARFSTWLTRIATHEALARVRRRGRRLEIEHLRDGEDDAIESLPARGPTPEKQALDRELAHALEASLDALPQLYRSVFMLRDVQGLSTAEAAECLEVTEDVVKTRLHRARALLREDLYERAGLSARSVFPFLGERCDRMVAGVFARLGLPTVH
jgi:RNA polymerase sigma-70 factor (ECF subfamily)